MKLKLINDNNLTKRIYLQDEIEQNISKIKNLSLDKNVYKSHNELSFYLQNDFIHMVQLKEYYLQFYEHIKNKMSFTDEELQQRKIIYNKKKMLDNFLILKENELELSYYRLICFTTEKDNIKFIFDKTENIYIHSNIQIHKMMNNFYILEDLSKITYQYLKDTKILIIEMSNKYEYKFDSIENIENENKILKMIKNDKFIKTKLYKNLKKIDNIEEIKTELKIPDKKLFIITEPQKIKYKDWIKDNLDKKKESMFFIMIILIYLQKNNCEIKNLSINNFFIRKEALEMNYKIEEFEYKINSTYQLYLDLHDNNEIELKSTHFSSNFKFLEHHITNINDDIYQTLHNNFYKYRFLKKFKVKEEKELSIIPIENYLFILDIFQIIYIFQENSYIPYIILKIKDNVLFLKSFNDESLEFDLLSKKKIYYLNNSYFNADIIL